MNSWTLQTPIRTLSEQNRIRHWSQVHKVAKAQIQQMTAYLVQRQVPRNFMQAAVKQGQRVRVTLTRLSPQTLDDDNLRASQKHTRDAIARWGGLDDGDARIEWCYAQGKNPRDGRLIALNVQIDLLPPQAP